MKDVLEGTELERAIWPIEGGVDVTAADSQDNLRIAHEHAFWIDNLVIGEERSIVRIMEGGARINKKRHNRSFLRFRSRKRAGEGELRGGSNKRMALNLWRALRNRRDDRR